MRIGAGDALVAGVPGMHLVPRVEAMRILESHSSRSGTYVVRPVLNGDFALTVTCVSVRDAYVVMCADTTAMC